jgi:hypothetical protein
MRESPANAEEATVHYESGDNEVARSPSVDHMPSMAEVARWATAIDVDAGELLARLLGVDSGKNLHVIE